jgi:hypothetical protein
MPKLSVSMLLPAFAVLCLLSSARTVHAESLSCASVNGTTVCSRSGAITCTTVDGRTVCTEGSRTSCETIGNQTVCRSGPNVQTFRSDPPSQETDPEDGDELDDDASPPLTERTPSPDKGDGAQRSRTRHDHHRQVLSIDRTGPKLRIRNGNLDLRID